MAAAAKTPDRFAPVTLRILAAVFGGYAVVYALTAALAAGLHRGGFDRVDSALISTNLAILVYPAIVLWAFAARRAVTVAGVLAATTALLALLAWTLGR